MAQQEIQFSGKLSEQRDAVQDTERHHPRAGRQAALRVRGPVRRLHPAELPARAERVHHRRPGRPQEADIGTHG